MRHATRVRWVVRLRRLRPVLASLAVLGLAFLVVVAGPGAQLAQADTLAPIGPIDVLPSEVAANAPKLLTGSGLADWTAGSLYSLVKSGNLRLLAEVAQEYPTVQAAQTAGAITADQTAALTSSLAADAVPVTSAEALGTAGVATVAGAADALGVGMLGFVLTNGVLRAVNVTSDGQVCMNTGTDPVGSLTRIATGTDCGKWAQNPAFKPNADQVTTYAGPAVCTSDGTTCIALAGQILGTFIDPQTQAHHSYELECANVTGSAPSSSPNGQFRRVGDAATVRTGFALQLAANMSSLFNAKACGTTWASLTQNATGTTTTFPTLPTTAPWAEYTAQSQPSGTAWTAQEGSGAAAQSVGVTPNPTRTMSCVTTGDNGVTYTGTGVSFTEKDSTLPMPPCSPLPAGVNPKSVKVLESAPGAQPHR